MMTHFSTRPQRQSQRDYILVVTLDGRIKTLRIQDILSAAAGMYPDTTRVVLTGESQELEGTVLNFQEPCPLFEVRCQNLLQAIEAGDCQGIDQHFAPRHKNPAFPEPS
ncbi:hypothetical protein [Deinococcus roseus]|uniref:Uncharacterized protein n=1 Tax=Deinococcus roseus TaxID=392414 RepID=A0ABQ2D3G7_9DEIO|nr:hypothetical protein [Deinococcus roseus]GGJ44735.1 hypothetical protein GCM10008938_33670 [Deinococcus roseus]